MEASFSAKTNAPGVGTGRSGIIEQGDRHQHLRGTGPETTSGGALPRLVQLNHFVAALGQPGDRDRNDRSLGYPTLLPRSGGRTRLAPGAASPGVSPRSACAACATRATPAALPPPARTSTPCSAVTG